MARPIDADALLELLKDPERYGYLDTIDILNAPTIEAEPVKQEWISVEDRLPTEEDGKNSNGAVIAIERHEGYAKRWDWGIVADYASEFFCWMPFPEPPKEGHK